jgi:AcrR family transcriptional regulator
VPTGVALRDPREQLFAAAERVLLRAGPNALTSRAVTTEAGCAKGVLHRHFADFDGFLVELIIDRINRIDRQAEALRAVAGTGSIVEHLTGALTEVFQSVARSILSLITFRDGLRARLREAGLTGVPVAAQAMAMVTSYLAAEQEHGRIAADADVGMLALSLTGSAHLLSAGQDDASVDSDAIRRLVTSVLGPTSPVSSRE